MYLSHIAHLELRLGEITWGSHGVWTVHTHSCLEWNLRVLSAVGFMLCGSGVP